MLQFDWIAPVHPDSVYAAAFGADHIEGRWPDADHIEGALF